MQIFKVIGNVIKAVGQTVEDTAELVSLMDLRLLLVSHSS